MGVDSDAPFIVFAKAAAQIKLFGPGTASGKTLCIAGDRVCSSAFGCTVQQSCRRIGAISTVVGKGSAVKHGVRAGDYIDAAEDICRDAAGLVEHIGNTVDVVMRSIHIDATHTEICIHGRSTADTNRRGISQSTV